MAQAIAETVFDVLYLSFALIAGLTMLVKGKDPLVKKAGLMAALLGAGDAFHLVPRSYSLWTTGLEANAAALGVGKFITSITMTIFYLILYYIWRERYQIKEKKELTLTMWVLSILRIALCFLPQNQWLEYRQPLAFGILRNIPFAIMGVIIIVIFAKEAGKGSCFPFHAAGSRSFLWLLPSGGSVQRGSSGRRHAHDSQNTCLCVDRTNGLEAIQTGEVSGSVLSGIIHTLPLLNRKQYGFE